MAHPLWASSKLAPLTPILQTQVALPVSHPLNGRGDDIVLFDEEDEAEVQRLTRATTPTPSNMVDEDDADELTSWRSATPTPFRSYRCMSEESEDDESCDLGAIEDSFAAMPLRVSLEDMALEEDSDASEVEAVVRPATPHPSISGDANAAGSCVEIAIEGVTGSFGGFRDAVGTSRRATTSRSSKLRQRRSLPQTVTLITADSFAVQVDLAALRAASPKLAEHFSPTVDCIELSHQHLESSDVLRLFRSLAHDDALTLPDDLEDLILADLLLRFKGFADSWCNLDTRHRVSALVRREARRLALTVQFAVAATLGDRILCARVLRESLSQPPTTAATGSRMRSSLGPLADLGPERACLPNMYTSALDDVLGADGMVPMCWVKAVAIFEDGLRCYEETVVSDQENARTE